MVIPESLCEEVMEELPTEVLGGHVGEHKMLQQLTHQFVWPGHSLDVKNWCKTCSTYASHKITSLKNCAPLQTIKAGSPTDIMGLLPASSNKNSYILVVVDYFTC